MRKTLALVVFALFLVVVFVFFSFGPGIRAALSPAVRIEYPVIKLAGGQMMIVLPAGAVRTGEDGGTFVWKLSRSSDYPENAFVVNAAPIAVEEELDGGICVKPGSLSISNPVAVEWTGELREGMLVRPVS